MNLTAIKKRGHGSVVIEGRTFFLEKESSGTWIGWFQGCDDDITEGDTPEAVIQEA